MEPEFWLNKWKKNEIGFHRADTNPLLMDHFPSMNIRPGGRIFLPLCGKSLDMHWLLSQGYQVVGAELSQSAVEQLFETLGLKPEVTTQDEFTRYCAENIEIFQGNIFQLKAEQLRAVDAVYDRAALVALPTETRIKYTGHLRELTGCASQLLVSFDYDQSKMTGPPFSVDEKEVRSHYQAHYKLGLLHQGTIRLKDTVDAVVKVWGLDSNRS